MRALAPLLLLAVALLSWGIREANEARVWRLPGGLASPQWVVADPDGLYHARRVERFLDEGMSSLAFDPMMSAPVGAPIPWPPYYDLGAALLLGPWVPDSPAARHEFLERAMGLLPFGFAILTSVVVALAGLRLGGRRMAWMAGLTHAAAWGSIQYSAPGVADHHAAVALGAAFFLFVFAEGRRRGALEAPGTGWRFGLATGLIFGLLMGVWVASLLFLVLAEALFLIWAWRDRSTPSPGLGPWAVGFHLSALVALWPALILSPWQEVRPWSVLELSSFHPALLAGLALVFSPFLVLAPRSLGRRRWPVLLLALGLLSCLGLALGIGPTAGLRSALDWASRANEFMGQIVESEPLLGADTTGTGGWLVWLGPAVLLAGLGWVMGVRPYEQRPELLPWLIALPLFLTLALVQRRFSDLAAIPIAVLVGFALSRTSWSLVWISVLGILGQAPVLWRTGDRLLHRQEDRRSVEAVRLNGVRSLHDWVRLHAVAGDSVLAHWDQGHAIESVSGMGSVATNFGSYLGDESFQIPARFFAATEMGGLERVLQDHKVRYVLVHAGLPGSWPTLGVAPWRESMAATLSHTGGPLAPGWLRLVFVAPYPDPSPDPRWAAGEEIAPAGFVWERVAGARLEVIAPAGTEVHLVLGLRYEHSGYGFLHEQTAVASADGRARLRVPYSTEAINGSGRVFESFVEIGNERMALTIPTEAVRSGGLVQIP